jgi:hypothetical protein
MILRTSSGAAVLDRPQTIAGFNTGVPLQLSYDPVRLPAQDAAMGVALASATLTVAPEFTSAEDAYLVTKAITTAPNVLAGQITDDASETGTGALYFQLSGAETALLSVSRVFWVEVLDSLGRTTELVRGALVSNESLTNGLPVVDATPSVQDYVDLQLQAVVDGVTTGDAATLTSANAHADVSAAAALAAAATAEKPWSTLTEVPLLVPSSATPAAGRIMYPTVPFSLNSAINFLAAQNPDLADGTLTGWTASDAANTSNVVANGRRWAQLSGIAAAGASLTAPTAAIPAFAMGRDLEVSMLVAGYVDKIVLRDQSGTTLRTLPLTLKLPDTSAPVRVTAILKATQLGTATGIVAKLFKGTDVTLALETLSVTEIQVAVAAATPVPLNRLGLSATGGTFTTYDEATRPAWLTTGWDESRTRAHLANQRRFGSTLVVWISADTLSTFDGAGVWTGFVEGYMQHLDRFLEICDDLGLSVVATIFSQTAWSGVAYSQQIVTNATVSAGYVNLCAAVAARYKESRALVALDICNEISTTLTEHLGYPQKLLYYPQARQFLTAAYQAIKSADPDRLALTSWSRPELAPIAPEEFCDAVGYTFHLGTSTDPATIPTTPVTNGDAALSYLIDQRLPMFASSGGASTTVTAADPDDGGTVKVLYRIPSVNSAFIRWFYTHLFDYGLEAFMPWHSPDVLYSSTTLALNAAGRAVQAAARTLPARPTRIGDPSAYPRSGGPITGTVVVTGNQLRHQRSVNAVDGLVEDQTAAGAKSRVFLINSTDGTGVMIVANGNAFEFYVGAKPNAADGSTTGATSGTQVASLSGGVLTLSAAVGLVIGGGTKITKKLSASVAWNPGTIAAGAYASTTVTVAGAVFGTTNPSLAYAGFGQALPPGVTIHAAVTATDTVTITIKNNTTGSVTIGSGTTAVRAVVEIYG